MLSLSKLTILSGIEVDATKLMLALRDVPNDVPEAAQWANQMYIIGMQSRELMEDLPDWESTARQAGWKSAEMTPGMMVKPVVGMPMAMAANTWKQACEHDDLVVPKFPCTRVFVVTWLLGAMLELAGERTDRTMFGWWMWADFREDQKREYFINTLAEWYEKSSIWSTQANELITRHAAQENSL